MAEIEFLLRSLEGWALSVIYRLRSRLWGFQIIDSFAFSLQLWICFKGKVGGYCELTDIER
uniref:Uncharacterized protein n=1 Tax=Megaselia scalaris TaxID=36166 RepID=T1GP13_MEGSC